MDSACAPSGLEDDRLLLVDAHVHLRRCFRGRAFIRSAYANFSAVASRLGRGQAWTGVLLLVDAPQEGGFERLLENWEQQNASGNAGSAAWSVQATCESTSLWLTSSDEKKMLVVAGRQVISRERLEVLAVGTRREFKPGMATENLIRAIARAGALPILPWGVGKWIGRRRKIVEGLLRNAKLPPFFLGDSANRPWFWPEPALFRMAGERGVHNLPGSDPLPLVREVQRVGSYGCILRGSLDEEKPAQGLKEKLLDLSMEVQPFGMREGALRFARNQLAMQYRKQFSS